MKTFKIKPLSDNISMWGLYQKTFYGWKLICKSSSIYAREMKNHLLCPDKIYTENDNNE